MIMVNNQSGHTILFGRIIWFVVSNGIDALCSRPPTHRRQLLINYSVPVKINISNSSCLKQENQAIPQMLNLAYKLKFINVASLTVL